MVPRMYISYLQYMPTYDTAAMVLITTADAFFAEC